MNSNPRKSSIIASLLAAAFVAGAGWAALELWPYTPVRRLAFDLLRGDPAPITTRTIATNLGALQLTSFSIGAVAPIAVTGGGIDAIGNEVLVMSFRGEFYLYRGQDAEQPLVRLDIGVDNGYELYRDHVAASQLEFELADSYFRFIDVVYDDASLSPFLWVSHHQWHEEEACFTVRLSRLALEAATPLALQSAIPADWEKIYDTVPCLPIDSSRPVFNGHLSGGRVVVAGDAVLMTVGDHAFDGWNYPEVLPQDPASDYGKILLIHPSQGSAEHVSIGHRNPQGLAVTSDGSIWATEHGPRGGDELNLIHEGANYGWPLVTYGVQYGMSKWPLSKSQNLHDGYTRPVFAWFPSIGVSNLIQVNHFLPAWEGDLLVASLEQQTLHRVRYSEGRVIFDEPIKIGSRIRDLDQLDDGTIVIWTNNAEIIELWPGASVEPDLERLVAELPESKRRLALSTIGTCLQCHDAEPGGDVDFAPNLWGVFGRRIADSDFDGYSEALEGVSGHWNDASLDAFLTDVQSFARGSTMGYPGIGDPAIRSVVIDYLEQLE